MNIIEQLDKEETARVMAGKTIPDFSSGDTIIVKVRILAEKIQGGSVSGAKTAANKGNNNSDNQPTERYQNYEGVVIGRKNRGLHSSFTVRKISNGEGVERTFPLYSPNVLSITVTHRGAVRRSKLYYLRDRQGKSARISADTTGHKAKEDSAV